MSPISIVILLQRVASCLVWIVLRSCYSRNCFGCACDSRRRSNSKVKSMKIVCSQQVGFRSMRSCNSHCGCSLQCSVEIQHLRSWRRRNHQQHQQLIQMHLNYLDSHWKKSDCCCCRARYRWKSESSFRAWSWFFVSIASSYWNYLRFADSSRYCSCNFGKLILAKGLTDISEDHCWWLFRRSATVTKQQCWATVKQKDQRKSFCASQLQLQC